MSLTNALFSSVSGLDTASTAISIIGDNIANANTPGFKEKRAEFSAVLGQSITAGSGFAQIGAGARTNNVGTIFSQGTFEGTARGTDLGIEGRGFFVLESGAGRSYSRAGLFGFDSAGTLVDALGNRVQGYGVDPATGATNNSLGDIVLTMGLSAPRATTTLNLAMNLDANEPVPAAFDPADTQNTSNAREVITIFDSLGSPREATVFFRKASPNNWEYHVTLADTDAGAPTGDPFVVQASGTLQFDAAGNLTGIDGGTADPTVTFNLNNANGAQAAQPVTFSMGNLGPLSTGPVSTQYRTSTVTNSVSQDGFAPGALTALEFDQDGLMNAVFSNGVTSTLAQVALANFGNVEGLTNIGASQVIQSVESGPPVIAGANSGSLGSIRSNALENSNVDLAQQFVKLIVSQRAFQANTRTVSVANELLANLVSLGQ